LNFITIINLSAADRSLDLTCPGLAGPTVDQHATQLINVWNFNFVLVQPGAKINTVIKYWTRIIAMHSLVIK